MNSKNDSLKKDKKESSNRYNPLKEEIIVLNRKEEDSCQAERKKFNMENKINNKQNKINIKQNITQWPKSGSFSHLEIIPGDFAEISIYSLILKRIFGANKPNLEEFTKLSNNIKMELLNNCRTKSKNNYVQIFMALTITEENAFSLFEFIFFMISYKIAIVFEEYEYLFLNQVTDRIINMYEKDFFNQKKYSSLIENLYLDNINVVAEKNQMIEVIEKVVKMQILNPFINFSKNQDISEFLKITNKNKKKRKAKILNEEDTELLDLDQIKNLENSKEEIDALKEYSGSLSFSYDIDCMYIWLNLKSNLKIFRSEQTVDLCFDKLEIVNKIYKNEVYVLTDSGVKKTKDLLFLKFATCRTPIGLLYIYFTTEKQYDAEKTREQFVDSIIFAANDFVNSFDSNIKYCMGRVSYAPDYMTTKRNRYEFDNDNDERRFTSKIQNSHKSDIIKKKLKEITMFNKMRSEEFTDLTEYIVKDNKCCKFINGIYISVIGSKGQCFSKVGSYALHKTVTTHLMVENFSMFILDAAMQFCSKDNDLFGKSLFLNDFTLNPNNSGLHNFLGSNLCQNYHKKNIKFNSKKRKIEIGSKGTLKTNNYSTLASLLFPRTLKLSKGLQFSAIGFLHFIYDQLGMERPNLKFLNLLDVISENAVLFKNKNFSYRLESTVLFSSFTVYFEIIKKKIKNQNVTEINTDKLISIICYYLNTLKKEIFSKKTSFTQLKKLMITEILIIQHFFKGKANTHQLNSKNLLKIINVNLTSNKILEKFNITKILEILEQRVHISKVMQSGKNLIEKSNLLRKKDLKVIQIYDKVLEVKTEHELCDLFFYLLNNLFQIKKNKIKLKKIRKNIENIEVLSLDEYFERISNLKISKIIKNNLTFSMWKLATWLHPDKIKLTLKSIETTLFSKEVYPIMPIYIDSKFEFYCIKNNNDETFCLTNISENTTKIPLPIYILNYTDYNLRKKKSKPGLTYLTLAEKARIIAGKNHYIGAPNIYEKIHLDIRFALFGIKSPTQIKDFILNHRKNMKKIESMKASDVLKEKMARISNLASLYRFKSFSINILEKFYNINYELPFYGEYKATLLKITDFFTSYNNHDDSWFDNFVKNCPESFSSILVNSIGVEEKIINDEEIFNYNESTIISNGEKEEDIIISENEDKNNIVFSDDKNVNQTPSSTRILDKLKKFVGSPDEEFFLSHFFKKQFNSKSRPSYKNRIEIKNDLLENEFIIQSKLTKNKYILTKKAFEF